MSNEIEEPTASGEDWREKAKVLETLSLSEAIETLKKISEDHGTHEGEYPKRLKIDDITRLPNVFQVRGGVENERHINGLRQALKIHGDLESIVVWACGDRVYLIDGHHRVSAYASEGRTTIPVRFISGEPIDALKAAARANTSTTLPMDNTQRQNLAWRLTVMGDLSIAEISRLTGVSKAQVSIMRRVKKELGDEVSDFAGKPWWIVQRREQNSGRHMEDDDIEALITATADRYADRMMKHFSTKLTHNETIAARTLEIYFGRKSTEVILEWIKVNPELEHLLKAHARYEAEMDDGGQIDF